MTVPIVVHHIHLYVPGYAISRRRTGTRGLFGGANGKRWHYEATDFAGINMNFSSTERPAAPTKGRTLDHIGFEVTNLKAFCKQLEANRIKLESRRIHHARGRHCHCVVH